MKKNRLLYCLVFMVLPWMLQGFHTTAQVIDRATIDSIVRRVADSVHMPGVSLAFINNGKIVYTKQYGYADIAERKKVDAQTIFEACSLSKPVFAWFVLKMADRQVIGLDTPLYTYLPYPELAYDERYKVITARMVLCHTSGLPNWVSTDPADSSLHLPAGAPYLKFAPGTGFNYSGTAYQYLVRVMSQLLHTDEGHLAEIVDREVCVRLHMQHSRFGWNDYIARHKATGYEQENDNGINVPKPVNRYASFNAAGGLHTNAADYAHFLIALRSGKGLSDGLQAQMLSPQPATGEAHWGLGIAVQDTPSGTRYVHSGDNGAFKSYGLIGKESGSGFVLLTNGNRMSDLRDALLQLFDNKN